MRLYLFLLIAFLPTIARTQQLPGQHILFYQLNTSHGLSDNYIHSMTVDKTGNLWIATGDGLNVFNGKTVKRYFSNEYPALKNDFYRQVLCDEKNRIWALADSGHVTIIDENRKFRYIDLADEKGFLPTRRIIQTKSKGIVLLTWRGQYSFDEKNFTRLTFSGPDTLPQIGFRQVKPFGEDDYLLVDFEGFYKVGYANSAVRKFTLSNIMALEKLPGGELLYYDEKVKQLRAFDFETGKISKPFAGIKDQLGNEISALINNACWISPGRLFLSTHKKGFYIYDFSARKLVNYRHDPADPSSVINNSPSAVTIDQSGWVFIGATPNGVSYFKSNAVIGEKQIFQDKKGQIYDGYINNLNSLDNETFYIGVSENVVIWNRPTNRSWFLENENDNKHWLKGTDVNHIAFDDRERIWVTASARGIRVYDKSHKIIASIQEDTSKAGSLPSNYIRHMEMGPDGYMWLSTRHGVCRVNTTNYKIEFPLAELYKVPCYRTWFPNPGEVWIATDQAGAWHYDLAGKRLTKYTTANGLTSNTTYCINGDKFNNIYIGTNKGLDIKLNNGKWKKISVAEGLLNKRIEALLLDRNGRMWIGNDVAIACFNIADTSVKVFDERYGLSVQGFRINSYFQASTDELIWGTEKGLQYFYPEQLLQQRVSLPGTITRIETPDYTVDLTSDASFRLGAGNNSVTFHFSAIDYSKHLRTFYEYKLEGADEQWTRVTDQNSVRYTSLPAGDYIFRLRTSNDSKVWEDAGNSVVLKIAKPVWQQTWFRAAGILVGIMLIWFVINFYRRRQRLQREELETEGVINYFASRINRHHETEDILWDIAKNCISKLQFEDCVIYLLDEERNVLVQKAAYGPKMERDFTIYQPIEIPLGRGIVGSVAMSGKPEIIANTDLDPRYIADDAKRHSEVAVPLIIDGKVIGVIDSENSKRNFFNQKHLNILSTIAVLCCNQIQRAKAEKEKQQAKIEVLQNRQKVMESRLQSLRLQMNPHFLFNALNSIQQMILANEEMVATRYLSRFSKLLRTILVHSDKEVVTLKEELEILNLYVELEAVRFRDSFNFRISCDENIDQEEVFVPTLLVQPFVENAIWHGLMHKEGNRQLQVRFEEADDFLSCIVEDNGVGREQAKLIRAKSMNGKTHTSKGIQVSLERLRAMRNDKGETGSLLITDLVDANGEAAGTRVEIKFPVLN